MMEDDFLNSMLAPFNQAVQLFLQWKWNLGSLIESISLITSTRKTLQWKIPDL
jgi:hypothetical protein